MKNVAKFNPEREHQDPTFEFIVNVNGDDRPFSFPDFVTGFFEVRQTSRRERRRFEVGDIVQTYLQDAQGNFLRDNRTRDRKIFWGEIISIVNTNGQLQRQVTVNERENNPRFEIFYFGIAEVRENVPVSLFV